MNNVYLSLGTNIGERENNLRLAVKMLQDTQNVEVLSVSSIYETAPVGYVDQPSFLNIAVHIQTPLSALEMLNISQGIENELGRVREIRWGPRIIDLDILLFNNDNIEVENLIVPHPRMFERAFVLVPLLEIAKEPLNEQLLLAKATLDNMDLIKEGITNWKTTYSVGEFIKE
ncbi:2-amino-4-hydroxy-6-hydroxymethyldihydropteridine diphosphokinase [Lysinibacillus composti]|uniref:2-amino-4-hydroxy-6-hydroxymethyldihydropteridine diphosphokinase n=1 Tax=Lysinibacillus composti TaxID=720633 RepID=A0A3N9U9I0_9BACI|nr:2-amino-4-hydroxy-6-hydroxymethyldihydropteridine diphosphokinase [Lysinibacillus composti]MBM7610119.1 2-amino-4-hydroxy-6-hydroxymethyldihydropteridine diphosphokinase [Lysinibacillus composti]RQW73234.1 2-amino-4-hydroxy-6-hydroxymethyldihydropteridine diphosphokinase [Lysinibacillus composti]